MRCYLQISIDSSSLLLSTLWPYCLKIIYCTVNLMIRRRPITFFILFTFLISYAIGIPFNMFVSGLLNKKNEVFTILLPRVATVYGPAIAAIIVSYNIAGREGIKLVLRKLLPSGKYALYFFIIPIISACITMGSYSLSGLPLNQILQFLSQAWWLLLLQWVIQFLIVGIGEETGWRGWLFPKLLENNSFPKTVTIVSLIWCLWHLPLLFREFNVVYPWLLILFSVSIILSWLWLKVNGNLFVLALAHASVNAPQAFIENRMIEARVGNSYLIAGWEILGFAYLLLGIVIVIIDYKYLKQNYFSPAPAKALGVKNLT